jgi:hypothetical protein
LLPLLAIMDNAAMEAEPLQRKRLTLRFSLRTLMIAVTLLCAVMAVVSSRANRQRRAVSRIKAAHGLVYYDYQLDHDFKPRTDEPLGPGPDWLRAFIGTDYFATVVSVRVNLASDELLEATAELPHLQDLRIACNSKISDGAWEHLKDLAEVETLYLRGMRDSATVNLAGLTQLRVLYITNTDVTDAGLASLKSLPRLQTLNMTGTKVTRAGITDLQVALPNCKIHH